MAAAAGMGAARAVGRAVWQAMKNAGRVAMPDNPEDIAEAVEKLRYRGRGDGNPNPPEPQPPFASFPVMEASRFSASNKLKLLKALIAAGVIYSVHKLDVAARHRVAKETGVGLFLAICAPATVPHLVVTKTLGMEPSEVASAASHMAGGVCPGYIPSNVQYKLPPAIPGTVSFDPRFDPSGFVAVVLLPLLSSLLDE